MFLLGRHAMFGHDPPTYLRSIAATRCPCPAKVQGAIVDPVPPPRITRSYSSGSVFLGNWAEETLFILFLCVSSAFLERSQDALAGSAERDALVTSCFSK